jgi:PAS domain S-box-containing protein
MLDARCGECLVFGALQGLADGLVLVDRDGRIFHLNRKAEELLGLTGQTVLGIRLFSCLRHPGLAAFWYSAEGEKDPISSELPFPSGATVRATVSHCVSSSGEPIGRALVLRDVTREKRINVELSASLVKRLMAVVGGQEPEDDLPPLTRRERQILQLLAGGLTNAEIARELHVSANTVASHVKHLYPKIGVNTRSQAAAYAVSHGILPPDR